MTAPSAARGSFLGAALDLRQTMLRTAAHIYAAIREKRAACKVLDLVECGFNQHFVERNYAAIAREGERIAADRACHGGATIP